MFSQEMIESRKADAIGFAKEYVDLCKKYNFVIRGDLGQFESQAELYPYNANPDFSYEDVVEYLESMINTAAVDFMNQLDAQAEYIFDQQGNKLVEGDHVLVGDKLNEWKGLPIEYTLIKTPKGFGLRREPGDDLDWCYMRFLDARHLIIRKIEPNKGTENG